MKSDAYLDLNRFAMLPGRGNECPWSEQPVPPSYGPCLSGFPAGCLCRQPQETFTGQLGNSQENIFLAPFG